MSIVTLIYTWCLNQIIFTLNHNIDIKYMYYTIMYT